MVVRRDTLTGGAWQCVGVSSLARRIFCPLILLALILLSTPPGVWAQAAGSGQESPEPAPEETGDAEYDHESALRARAVRVRTAIDVDGRLDEPVWA